MRRLVRFFSGGFFSGECFHRFFLLVERVFRAFDDRWISPSFYPVGLKIGSPPPRDGAPTFSG